MTDILDSALLSDLKEFKDRLHAIGDKVRDEASDSCAEFNVVSTELQNLVGDQRTKKQSELGDLESEKHRQFNDEMETKSVHNTLKQRIADTQKQIEEANAKIQRTEEMIKKAQEEIERFENEQRTAH